MTTVTCRFPTITATSTGDYYVSYNMDCSSTATTITGQSWVTVTVDDTIDEDVPVVARCNEDLSHLYFPIRKYPRHNLVYGCKKLVQLKAWKTGHARRDRRVNKRKNYLHKVLA